ncbi:hypothetical protein H4582DRAFT_1399662 [Lactarius indigo]|nr:hypothetical protein H4582DRAFT_1399662 [Lactarius indigo]
MSKVKRLLAFLSAGNVGGPSTWQVAQKPSTSNIACDRARSPVGLVTGFLVAGRWPLVWSASIALMWAGHLDGFRPTILVMRSHGSASHAALHQRVSGDRPCYIQMEAYETSSPAQPQCLLPVFRSFRSVMYFVCLSCIANRCSFSNVVFRVNLLRLCSYVPKRRRGHMVNDMESRAA